MEGNDRASARDVRRLLITGGAGFVGANLALAFKTHFPHWTVTCFDNLSRRGSELNLARLKEHGIEFVHGDVRCREDTESWKPFDLLIDCSAQPSVQSGLDGSPLPVLQNNLLGTIHCAEAARRCDAALLFLSTSRVYPIEPLNQLPYHEEDTRFRWAVTGSTAGLSEEGVAETFTLHGARSLYGATKLASELILQEYAYSYRLPVLINRCGILAGPWQMGKVDQGVVTYWVARHVFGRPLRYTGFGGSGKQVRDLLHVHDLFELLLEQLKDVGLWDGRVYNVGGGRGCLDLSLLELTELCRETTGVCVPIDALPQTSPVDLRLYITDARRVMQDYAWRPRRDVRQVVEEITRWVCDHRNAVAPVVA